MIEEAVSARGVNPGRRKAPALVAEPSPAAVHLALPPLVQLGAARRWPTSHAGGGENGVGVGAAGGGSLAGGSTVDFNPVL